MTRCDHSHNTMQAAAAQNRTNTHPPNQATAIVSGAITADEITRSARLLRAGAKGWSDKGWSDRGWSDNLRTGLGRKPAEAALATAVFLDRGFQRGAIEIR